MVSLSLASNVRSQIAEIKRKFKYAKDGHAFAYFSTELVFDLEEEETLDCCSVGIFGHDRGIDGVLERDGKLFIIQAKYPEKQDEKKPRTFGRKDLLDPDSALKFLASPPVGIEKAELLKAIELYKAYAESGKEIVLVLMLFGKLSAPGQEYVDSLKAQLPTNHSVEAHSFDEIIELFAQTAGLYSGKGPDISFEARDIMLRKKKETLPRSVICTISGKELARIVNLHREDIFQINVREFLKKTRINKQIESYFVTNESSVPSIEKEKKTKEREIEKKYFWYYNLGLTAIADKVKPDTDRIVANNLRIVNGCQTASIMQGMLQKLKTLRSS